MNLYLISQTKNDGYDTFDAAVVAAETEEQAKLIHPDGCHSVGDSKDLDTWVNGLDDVKATLIGTAVPGTNEGVILSSFNAG